MTGPICSRCKNPIKESTRNCSTCGEDCGYPNVRKANRPEQIAALNVRVADARNSAAARSCMPQLDAFEAKLKGSFALMVRSLLDLQRLIGDSDLAYVSHRKQIEAGMRDPRSNQFDQVRSQYEEALFPNYHSEMLFAFLSLNGTIVPSYGGGAVVLKEIAISHRSSVFEENPFSFYEKHRLLKTQDIPEGYRADWQRRSDVAIAKLATRISNATQEADFPRILLDTHTDPNNPDFVEVHIFGPISRQSIERVVLQKPSDSVDRHTWQALLKLCRRNKIPTDELG